MTHNKYKNTYLHTIIDVDKKYGGQCVDVARHYMSVMHNVNNVEGVNGAVDFYTKYDSMLKLKSAYRRIKYRPGMICPQGALVIWGTTKNNSCGHIAICDEATQSTLTILEQNGFNNPARDVSKGDTDGLEVRTTSYSNVIGWLILKEKTPEIKVTGAVPPTGAKIATSDRTAQNGDYWLNISLEVPKWMLLVNGKWNYI